MFKIILYYSIEVFLLCITFLHRIYFVKSGCTSAKYWKRAFIFCIRFALILDCSVFSHIARYAPSHRTNNYGTITQFKCKNNFEHLLISRFHFFFACGKCAGMPVDKGLNADSKVWQTFEVRYWAAKKFGERDTRVVSLLSRSQAAPQHSSWEPALVALHSVCTDIAFGEVRLHLSITLRPKQMKKQYSLLILIQRSLTFWYHRK